MRRQGDEVVPLSKIYTDLESGEEITYLLVPTEKIGDKQLFPGDFFQLPNGSQFIYWGKREDNGEPLITEKGKYA